MERRALHAAPIPRISIRLFPNIATDPHVSLMNLSNQASPFSPGDVVAERYRVERVLGAGGMGVVVSARHLELDSLVAIKFLRPEALENPEAVARFTREARAAVKIKSEHVARVMDVGTLPNGAPYMVMEHLEGSDLSAHLRNAKSLSIGEVLDYVLQACEAIAEAHSLGIVHRDLKPGNLFLSHRADGSKLVKVLDFGISKIIDPTGSGPSASMTATSALLGSPTYMSPEQLTSSRDVDARADIWALGIILFELLTTRLPFVAETIPQLCISILQVAPPSLRSLRSDIPAGLESIVSRCIEKDRSRRFANVGELAVALAEFAPEQSRLSVERIVRLAPARQPSTPDAPAEIDQNDAHLGEPTLLAPASSPDTQGTWGRTASRGRPTKRARPYLIAGGFAAALVTGLLIYISGSHRPSETSAMSGSDVATAPIHGPTAAAPQPSTAAIPATAIPATAIPTAATPTAATSAAAAPGIAPHEIDPTPPTLPPPGVESAREPLRSGALVPASTRPERPATARPSPSSAPALRGRARTQTRTGSHAGPSPSATASQKPADAAQAPGSTPRRPTSISDWESDRN